MKGELFMAVRQYIGARYVPKFFDWDGSPEWRSGVEYEALTIVTRNGNSYTSKIPVPSNIGAPESNPTYWVATGLYNEQIESIRQGLVTAQGDIDALDGRMDTTEGDIDNVEGDVDALTGRVTTAEGDIDGLAGRLTTAEGDIDSIEQTIKVNNSERIIVLGDSYGLDNASGGNSWFSRLQAIYGSNMQGQCVGGLGFYSDITSTNANFESVLSNMTVDEPETIKRIYVFGGANDANIIYGSPTHIDFIGTRILSFINYCHNRFPNAMVYVGFIGWYRDSARWLSYYAVRNAYKQACASSKYSTYITGIDYCMHINCAINATDLVHPTATGSALLSYMIQQVVIGGSLNPVFNLVTGITPTPGAGISSIQNLVLKVAYNGAFCSITFGGNFNVNNSIRFNIASGAANNPVYPNSVKLIDMSDWLPIGPYHVDDYVQGATVSGVLYDGTTYTNFNGYIALEDDGIYLKCFNMLSAQQTMLIMGSVTLTYNMDNYGFRR